MSLNEKNINSEFGDQFEVIVRSTEEVESLLKILQRHTEEVIPVCELQKKLQYKKKLIIKLGADPTAPHIHLGHTIVLEKLREFQNFGFEVVFLIGDFTAQIGDPTGKSKTRPVLSREVIESNVQTYIDQIGKIIDINKLKIVYNSSWFNNFSSVSWIQLCAKITLSQVIERDDFSNRLQNNVPIGMHELFYPLLQGYDSVYLSADVEIGGTDQKFNMLMGRRLQDLYQKEQQVIITMPILPGIDGVQKMSKSLGNDIALTDSAQNAFLKIMSISDDLMVCYYQYILHIDISAVQSMISQDGHIETKKQLAKKIIEKYWSCQDAKNAYDYFTSVFQKKEYKKDNLNVFKVKKGEYKAIDFVVMIKPSLSRSSARRLFDDGAISINGIKINDYYYVYFPKQDDVVKIGKQIICSIGIFSENEY